jgi:hypothetical protein
MNTFMLMFESDVLENWCFGLQNNAVYSIRSAREKASRAPALPSYFLRKSVQRRERNITDIS